MDGRVTARRFEGSVAIVARIVEHRDFLHVFPYARRDALQHLRQRGDRVEGNNQNADSLALAFGKFRLILHDAAVQRWQRLKWERDRSALLYDCVGHFRVNRYELLIA